ncbi:MAG TPA: hypothetical protein VFL57_09135 [Bryobacteraceae bacterium]|nr:hypothetical protein [Bryobacteraceae bacterium]
MSTALLLLAAGVLWFARQPTNPNHQNPPPTGVEDTTSTGRRAEPGPEIRRGTEKVVKYEGKTAKPVQKRKARRAAVK